MKIKFNNTDIEIMEQNNLQQVLDHCGYSTGNFAVAVNGSFIPKTGYCHCQIYAGDEVIIIQPMQGG